MPLNIIGILTIKWTDEISNGEIFHRVNEKVMDLYKRIRKQKTAFCKEPVE